MKTEVVTESVEMQLAACMDRLACADPVSCANAGGCAGEEAYLCRLENKLCQRWCGGAKCLADRSCATDSEATNA